MTTGAPAISPRMVTLTRGRVIHPGQNRMSDQKSFLSISKVERRHMACLIMCILNIVSLRLDGTIPLADGDLKLRIQIRKLLKMSAKSSLMLADFSSTCASIKCYAPEIYPNLFSANGSGQMSRALTPLKDSWSIRQPGTPITLSRGRMSLSLVLAHRLYR